MKIESRIIIQSNSRMGDLNETTHHSQIPHVQENTGISQHTPFFVNLSETTVKRFQHEMKDADIPPSHTTWRYQISVRPDRRKLISDQKPYYKVQQYPHDLDLLKVLPGNRGLQPPSLLKTRGMLLVSAAIANQA